MHLEQVKFSLCCSSVTEDLCYFARWGNLSSSGKKKKSTNESYGNALKKYLVQSVYTSFFFSYFCAVGSAVSKESVTAWVCRRITEMHVGFVVSVGQFPRREDFLLAAWKSR